MPRHPIDPISFIHKTSLTDYPAEVIVRAKMCLLDLIGIAAGGTKTQLSQIIHGYARDEMSGPVPFIFHNGSANRAAAAMAIGMGIDSLDGHDGFNPSKGHIGAPMFPALYTAAIGQAMSGADFLAALIVGYELGARTAIAQHRSCPDYHTSGSWGAVAAAGVAARVMGLDAGQTRHALGIAEYHGPRSQMMRCIDHPTMVKDGAGWGAMCGVSAAGMAARGFTGAPAITVEQASDLWQDAGQRWYMLEQYYKPYPVCRWAQAPVEAALSLRRALNLQSSDIQKIDIETFHESVRLATATPKTTEEAQYSTSFPVAIALARGGIAPDDLDNAALQDPEILRLSQATHMHESDMPNAEFPLRRFARVRLTLSDGNTHESDWFEPAWDHTAPPSPADIAAKYHALSDPILGAARAAAIEDSVMRLDKTQFDPLAALLRGAP